MKGPGYSITKDINEDKNNDIPEIAGDDGSQQEEGNDPGQEDSEEDDKNEDGSENEEDISEKSSEAVENLDNLDVSENADLGAGADGFDVSSGAESAVKQLGDIGSNIEGGAATPTNTVVEEGDETDVTLSSGDTVNNITSNAGGGSNSSGSGKRKKSRREAIREAAKNGNLRLKPVNQSNAQISENNGEDINLNENTGIDLEANAETEAIADAEAKVEGDSLKVTTKSESLGDSEVSRELLEAAEMLKEAAEMLNDNYSGNNEEVKLKDDTDNIDTDNNGNQDNNSKKEENEDSNFIVTDEGDENSDTVANTKKDRLINKPIRFMERGRRILSGEEGIFDPIREMTNSDLKPKNIVGRTLLAGEEFFKQGGAQELHKGFNEVRDTFFVSPGGGSNAPGDWKNTQKEFEQRQKEKNEKNKGNIVNNKMNQNFIIKNEGLIEKYERKYKGQNKSADYIRDKAEEEAKSKLTSLCDTYMPMGLSNVEAMYNIDKDRKEYGISAREAIIQRADFEKFNQSSKSVKEIIIKGSFEKTADKINRVTDVIPDNDARKYYHAGYSASQMTDLNMIVEKLGVTSNKAMQIYEVGKRKGNVEYKGQDENIQKAFEQLNQRLFRNQ